MSSIERHDEEERNQARAPEEEEKQTSSPEMAANADGGGRVRREQARELSQRVDQLLLLLGDLSLATHIGLLKRDLSRCHDALRDYPDESNYLSIITLVESALTQLKWKQYTRSRLQAIHKALDIGSRQVRVSFADYEKVQQLLSDANVDASPRLDLEAVSWNEIANEEDD